MSLADVSGDCPWPRPLRTCPKKTEGRIVPALRTIESGAAYAPPARPVISDPNSVQILVLPL
jgi:hypothetical protein